MKLQREPYLGKKYEYLRSITKRFDWDSDKGLPIEDQIWDRVEIFVEKIKLFIPNLKDPFVSPCGDGSVHVKYGDFLIEFWPEKYVWKNKNICGACSDFEEMWRIFTKHMGE